LFLLSTIFALWPRTAFLFTPDPGVPVKNAATQSGEFVACIAVLFYLAFALIKEGRRVLAMAALLLAAVFMANIFYVATSRTALVVLPVLILTWGFGNFGTKGKIILLLGMAAVAATALFSSPYLRARSTDVWTDIRAYQTRNAQNSSSERLEFWRKSAAFVAEAPLAGHGTGAMHDLFIKAAIGQTGAAASATTNPHNQTFAVAIQLGLIGGVLLWAMWVAHLLLFRTSGLVEWIGLVVVAQNVVGSLFNSHLFDFTQGWFYVVGVGVAGGMVLKQRATNPDAAA
jgi:O-antigen ligase